MRGRGLLGRGSVLTEDPGLLGLKHLGTAVLMIKLSSTTRSTSTGGGGGAVLNLNKIKTKYEFHL